MLEIIFLQAGGNNYSQFIMLGGMIAIFYFFFIRPQQKKQKDTKKFIEAVKKGKKFVSYGIKNSLNIGKGHGPLDHFPRRKKYE